MSNSSTNTSDVFDLRKLRRLVELMNEHELSEIELRKGDARIRIRRGGDAAPAPAEPRQAVQASAAAATSQTVTATTPTPEEPSMTTGETTVSKTETLALDSSTT